MEVVDAVVPMIYTSEGNVPIDSVTYKYEWSRDTDNIYFKEAWFNADGKLVKNNVHMYALNGISMQGEQFTA